MPKFVIYTSIFGNYDTLKTPLVYDKEKYDYICLTDNANALKTDTPENEVWEIREIETKIPEDLAKSAKYPKILPHLFFPEYEYSLYIDGSMTLKKFPDILGLLGKYVIVNEIHPTRKCIYDEIAACLRLGKGKREDLLRQLAFYEQIGVPKGLQVRCNWLLVRKHNDPELIVREEKWWKEVEMFSSRDQISFPWVFRDFPVGVIPHTTRQQLVDINYWHG